MASVGSAIQQETSVLERVTRNEARIDQILTHFATKADLERTTRIIVMWVIATQIAVVGMLLTACGIGVALILNAIG